VNTDEVDQWHEKRLAKLIPVEQQLLKDFPEIAQLRSDHWAQGPPVRLMCPRCDRLLADVCVRFDTHVHLALCPVNVNTNRMVGVDSSPVGGHPEVHGAGGARVTFPCRNKRCRTTPTLTNDRLLRIYGTALQLGMREIVLPG
jgi:hypothetical protein